MSDQTISFIVAMNQDRVIGKNNDLPWDIPEDFKYFKDTTIGHPIIMGRKTFDSLKVALPNRKNIVVTRNSDFSAKDVEVYSNLKDALLSVKNEPEVFVIGGGEIFKMALEMGVVNKLYITVVNYPVEGEDLIYFPDIDMTNWSLVKEFTLTSKSGVFCTFSQYIRN